MGAGGFGVGGHRGPPFGLRSPFGLGPHLGSAPTEALTARGGSSCAPRPLSPPPHSMSWFSALLVPKVDERKTAWGDRNGPKAPPRPAPRCGRSGDADPERRRDAGPQRPDDDGAADGGPQPLPARRSRRPALRRLLRLFRSRRFPSAKLERLYQRYFAQLNRRRLAVLLGLQALLCALLLLLHCAPGAPRAAVVAALSAAAVLAAAMAVLCGRGAFPREAVRALSYAALGLLAAVPLLGAAAVAPRGAAEGVWWSVFGIYAAYALLPVRMRAAVLAGALLAVLHLGVTWHLCGEEPLLWRQVGGGAKGGGGATGGEVIGERGEGAGLGKGAGLTGERLLGDR